MGDSQFLEIIKCFQLLTYILSSDCETEGGWIILLLCEIMSSKYLKKIRLAIWDEIHMIQHEFFSQCYDEVALGWVFILWNIEVYWYASLVKSRHKVNTIM